MRNAMPMRPPNQYFKVQANLREHFPITPQEGQGVPLGVEMRNAMPMRPLNQDFRVQVHANGWGFEPRKNRPIGEGFMNQIEEQGFGGINAKPIPSLIQGYPHLYLFVRAWRCLYLLWSRLVNERLDLDPPMGGLHGNIPCKPRAYHSHSPIVAHFI